MRDRTGVAPQASRLLACRKGGCVAARDKPPSCLRQGREFRFYTWEETRGRKGMACVSARLTAGKSCPLFKLVAGEASPAPPGRGQSPLPSPLKGALPPTPLLRAGCVAARDRLPSCLRQGRGLRHVSWVRIREGAWKPILLARLAAGKSCPLFKLVATP